MLIESLWPDEPSDSARRSLNTHLSYLRRALEPHLPARTSSRYVLRTGEGYRLAASVIRSTSVTVPPSSVGSSRVAETIFQAVSVREAVALG